MRDLTEGAAYLPRVISHRMPAWQRRWEGTPMLKVVEDAAARVELAAGLDEIVREGARRMLAAALEAEVEAYLAAHAGERDEAGRRLVVRNGHARARQVTTVAGAVEVRVPRVDDRRVDAATGERRRFRSALLPPWCRRSPKVTEVLPLLYLHGLSSKDFVPALEEFFGAKAGLSASVVTRLTASWQDEQRRFAERDLSGVDYVYAWVDGVHFSVRLDDDPVLKGQIEAIPLPDASVDVVISNCVINLSTDKPAVFAQTFRSFGPAGAWAYPTSSRRTTSPLPSAASVGAGSAVWPALCRPA